MLIKLYRHLRYLKDVLVLAVTAFGGPNAHISLMLDFLVAKRKYLTEKELLELMALCQLLPGPTSTQTITAIGYKRGGPLLALVTLLIWALPAVILMTLLAALYTYFVTKGDSVDFFRFIHPLAVGFIAYAAFAISKKVVHNGVTIFLIVVSAIVTILLNSPWIFPIVILFGGLVTNFTSKEKVEVKETKLKPNWIYLILYAGIFVAAGAMSVATNYKPVVLFENFYRFGSLVFGGGQVLIPMMLEQFTQHKDYVTKEQFLTGYGMVQAVPGPVFSFAAYTGALSLQDMGRGFLILGSLIGAIGIFLPGALLIFFVYPLWEYLKKYKVVQRSLEGINAAAAGLVVAAAFILFMALEVNVKDPGTTTFFNIAIVLATFIILWKTKIPAPVLVVIALIAGFLI